MNRLFYVLNSNTNFDFPHMNCDTYSYVDLKKRLLSPDYFIGYMAVMFGAQDVAVILKKLESLEDVCILGTAWMRLKFMAEAINSNVLCRMYNPRLKTPDAHVWAARGVMRYITVDRYANTFINIVMNTVEAIVEERELPTINPEYVTLAAALNSDLPAIRASPLGEYRWERFAPHELAPLPYYTFITRLYEPLASVLTCPSQQSE
jgi:hypothetical protein